MNDRLCSVQLLNQVGRSPDNQCMGLLGGFWRVLGPFFFFFWAGRRDVLNCDLMQCLGAVIGDCVGSRKDDGRWLGEEGKLFRWLGRVGGAGWVLTGSLV